MHKSVIVWRSMGKQADARNYVQVFNGKTRTKNKPKATKNSIMGKQTTITFNNSQRTKETLWLYIQKAIKAGRATTIEYFSNRVFYQKIPLINRVIG